MYTPAIRILLALSSLGTAFFFYTKEDFFSMAMSLMATGLFVYGYFKYGTVYAAFQQVKKGNFKKAEKLISMIKNPENLDKSQKGYYHFIKGLIASEKEEWEPSLLELTKALKIGLRTENDTSIVLLNLANVEFERRNYQNAEEFINKGRKYNLKPFVKSEMDKLMEKLNQFSRIP